MNEPTRYLVVRESPGGQHREYLRKITITRGKFVRDLAEATFFKDRVVAWFWAGLFMARVEPA